MEKSEPVKKDRPDAVKEEGVDAEVAAVSEDAGKSPQGEGLEATEAEDAEATKAQDVEAAKEVEAENAAPVPKLHVTCTVGVERQLQVLLPDR